MVIHFTPHGPYTVHMKHHVANTELLDLSVEILSQLKGNAQAMWGEGRACSASAHQALPGQDRQDQNNTLEKLLQGIRLSSSVTDLLWTEQQISPHPGYRFTET